jgi:hypothetical protein
MFFYKRKQTTILGARFLGTKKYITSRTSLFLPSITVVQPTFTSFQENVYMVPLKYLQFLNFPHII